MKRLKPIAVHLGIASGSIFLLFLIPYIYNNFDLKFILLLRQVLIMTFAISLGIAPEELLQAGIKLAPHIRSFATKIISIINIILGKSNEEGKD